MQISIFATRRSCFRLACSIPFQVAAFLPRLSLPAVVLMLCAITYTLHDTVPLCCPLYHGLRAAPSFRSQLCPHADYFYGRQPRPYIKPRILYRYVSPNLFCLACGGVAAVTVLLNVGREEEYHRRRRTLLN